MGISNKVIRLLWSFSGGYCQNPNCRRELFYFFDNGEVTSIEELAHIIPQSPDGPRGDEDPMREGIDEYDNIILLCPTCHSLIDKNPKQYPADLLKAWKAEHSNRIKRQFVAPVFGTRQDLRQEVAKLMRRNRQIFMSYGPFSDFSQNPLSEAADLWRQYVRNEIIPNNRRLTELLVVNDHLLTDTEREIFDQFMIHKDAFEYNHLSGDKNPTAPRFPEEMETILGD